MFAKLLATLFYNYGDGSNFFTSQANDYLSGKRDLSYFQHLFLQAHSQNATQDTFALIGLENSMSKEAQTEFVKQLEFIKSWQNVTDNKQVLKASTFAQNFTKQQTSNPQLTVYEGQDQVDPNEKVWWLTTPYYRLRLRLSNEELFISDLRIYDESFTDPYLSKQAEKLGWWIIPFIIDGSRYLANDQSRQFDYLANDDLRNLKNSDLKPTRLIVKEQIRLTDLQTDISPNEMKLTDLKSGSILAIFTAQTLALNQHLIDQTSNALLEQIQQAKPWSLEKTGKQGDLLEYQLQIKNEDNLLEQMRKEHYPLLFPELSDHPLDANLTYLYKNNRFAVAGRNPVRLVLFPRDQYAYPINLANEPSIESQLPLDSIEVKKQSAYNGMLFLDFNSKQVLKTQVSISKDGWQEQITIYFAPNCKSNLGYCLTHPRQALWYVASFLGDKWRAIEEAIRQHQKL